MEPDIVTDKKDDSEAYAVDTRKTYEGILSRKEAELAREAQFERRALALTKHFLKSHEQKESHRLDDLHEASQRSYDRSMAKVKRGCDSEAMLKEMVREEKNQISQLMAERLRQRELEEDKKREAKAEREYYMQARIVHHQMQAEERHRNVEEQQRERADAIKDRMQRHQERQKEILQEKNESQTTTAAKFDSELEKVLERRKHNDMLARKERHEKRTARAERGNKALDNRQKQVEQRQQGMREAEEERHRKVLERKRVEQQELLEKVNRMKQEDEEKFQRSIGPSSSRSLQETSHSEPHGRLGRATVVSTMAANPEETKQEDERKTHSPTIPTFHSQELVDLNNQAHRDYMMRRKELDTASQKMNVQKRYKAVADGALPGASEDYRSARLKGVCQTHMASKPKEPKKDTPISTRGAQRPTPRAIARPLKCGLCDREYPTDHLVGSALRRTIERLRHQSPKLSKEAPRRRSAAGAPDNGEDSGDGNSRGSIQRQPTSPSNKKPGLYDYEVKLCVNCDIFVRIAST